MLTCDNYSFCQNFGKGCSFCIHSPYPRSNAIDKFVSYKCGLQSMICARCHDYEACYDCDPYDPPCSLFRRSISFGGGDTFG